MNTPEPVDEVPFAPAETRGGDRLADITVSGSLTLPAFAAGGTVSAGGCDDEDCACEEPA